MSAAQIASQSAVVRNELLRSTYRVDSEAHPEIVGPALAAAKALGVSVPFRSTKVKANLPQTLH